jgi:hypothetical protein
VIARVRFDLDGTPVTATLGDDRRWSVPGWPDIESYLNAACDPAEHEGPAHGQAGHIAAHAAARTFKGTVEFPPRRPPPEGAKF